MMGRMSVPTVHDAHAPAFPRHLQGPAKLTISNQNTIPKRKKVDKTCFPHSVSLALENMRPVYSEQNKGHITCKILTFC